MKVIVAQSKYSITIKLIPEQMHETIGLIDFSLNAKDVKPEVRFILNNSEPCCSIYLKKRDPKVQKTIIRNKSK
jgi:hypothetical protein